MNLPKVISDLQEANLSFEELADFHAIQDKYNNREPLEVEEYDRLTELWENHF